MASVAASLNLSGMNFFPTNKTLSAVVVLAECFTASWTATTSVVCIGTRGRSSVGTIGLSVAGIVGTTGTVFSFDGDAGYVGRGTMAFLMSWMSLEHVF